MINLKNYFVTTESRRRQARATKTSDCNKQRSFNWRMFAISVVLAAVALAAFPALPGMGEAHAQRTIQLSAMKRTATIQVPVGKSEDVRFDASFIDIAVSDANIADVSPLTDRGLSILGKKIGTTRVTIYGEGKKLLGVFDVEVSYDISQLSAEITRRFPGSGLKVSSVNGRIMLSGTAPDGIVLDRALVLAKQFGSDAINSVTVAQPQQVMLEVRFVEASRQAGRDLGVQWNVFNKNAVANVGSRQTAEGLPISKPATVAGEIAAGVLSGGSPFGFLVGRMINGGTTIDALINALEKRGLARKLAEPNLVALSGDTASFLAGGEYPIPVSSSLGQVTVQYKRYGIGLAFTPTVLNGSLINLKIEPEVSQLDWTNKVAISESASVPALTVRRANTTLELRDGQSFALAGLLQNDSNTSQEQLPWLGDVPVLGALFSSKSYQKSETDLVIIVTPRLVRPARPGDVLKTPLDNTVPGNDLDFFLHGQAEITRTELRRRLYGPAPLDGHMLDLSMGGGHVAMQ